MLNNKTKKKKNTNKKRDWSFYAIIVCLIILAIPAAWLGWEIIHARLSQGSPILGNRFENDLENKIEESHINVLKEQIQNIEGVEKVNIELKTATLRILALVPQESTVESMESITDEIYAIIGENLPIETYFTSAGSIQQYDIEIGVYNMENVTEENQSDYILIWLNKSGLMDKPIRQQLTKAQAPAYIEELKKQQAEEESQATEETEEEISEE